jgi:hypothetical protein
MRAYASRMIVFTQAGPPEMTEAPASKLLVGGFLELDVFDGIGRFRIAVDR